MMRPWRRKLEKYINRLAEFTRNIAVDQLKTQTYLCRSRSALHLDTKTVFEIIGHTQSICERNPPERRRLKIALKGVAKNDMEMNY
jgi:hypothetical protein